MICPPALIYAIFSVVQIIIDLFTGLYNTALMKVFIAIVITVLLNWLCSMDLSFISWIIVLIPFLFMGVSVSILLYAFGLDVAQGRHPKTTVIPQPFHPYKPCHEELVPNWEPYNGNIHYLPGYKTVNLCKY
jgi:hypothetical protein